MGTRSTRGTLSLCCTSCGAAAWLSGLAPSLGGQDKRGDWAQGGQTSRILPILLIFKRILFSSLFLFSVFSSPSRQGCTEMSGSVLKRQQTYKLGDVSLKFGLFLLFCFCQEHGRDLPGSSWDCQRLWLRGRAGQPWASFSCHLGHIWCGRNALSAREWRTHGGFACPHCQPPLPGLSHSLQSQERREEAL